MQRKELKARLKKTYTSWNHIWDFIENLLKNEPAYRLKELLFRYQVELDSNYKKMEVVEQRLNDESVLLTDEDYYVLDQILSWLIADHQAKTLFIDNFIK